MKSLLPCLPIAWGLLTALPGSAGSFLGFETIGTSTSADGQVLAQQYRATMGIRFSRADGGSVKIAKVGLPVTGFAAGTDDANPAAGDSLLPSDPWGAQVGSSFIALSGVPGAALVIDYDYPTAAASGLLLDVDRDETWVIRAYSDAGSTLVAETTIAGGSPGTGDQVATPWAVVRPSAEIVQLRLVQTGGNANAGAGLDLFHPYGLFDFSSETLRLAAVNSTANSLGLQLTSTPGHRVRLESSDAIDSGSWNLEQVVTPASAVTDLLTALDIASDRRFYRANGPSPETDRAALIYSAVNGFLSTLSAAQLNTVVYAAGNTTQRSHWSNFPTGIFQRNGLKIGSMNAAQITALYAMLGAVLSPEGFQKVARTMTGDQTLGGGNYGTNEYYVSS